jgi:leucyl-tRNA---protein transferase
VRIGAPTLLLHRTLPAPCPYLDGRIEQRVVVSLEEVPDGTFDRLSRTGFRRSHTFAYRPACPGCAACIPIRVPTAGRHGDGDMAQMSFADFRAMIEDAVGGTRLIEHRDAAGRLAAVVLIDRLSDGLSAVYSFFDAARPGLSLGTYAVLDMIRRARAEALPYVYLGYWIADSRKMAYKSRFRPAEILVAGCWQPFTPRSGGSAG